MTREQYLVALESAAEEVIVASDNTFFHGAKIKKVKAILHSFAAKLAEEGEAEIAPEKDNSGDETE